ESRCFECGRHWSAARIALWRRGAGTPRLTLATAIDPQRPADRLAVSLGNWLLGVVLALVLLGLLVEAVAQPGVAPHELAVPSHADPLGDALLGLDLRHWSAGPPSLPPAASASGA